MSVVITTTFFARIGPLPSPSTSWTPCCERRYPLAAAFQVNVAAYAPWNGRITLVAGSAPVKPPAVGSVVPEGTNASAGTSTGADPPDRFTASRSAGVLVNSLFGALRNA